jgi:hypothetical protein
MRCTQNYWRTSATSRVRLRPNHPTTSFSRSCVRIAVAGCWYIMKRGCRAVMPQPQSFARSQTFCACSTLQGQNATLRSEPRKQSLRTVHSCIIKYVRRPWPNHFIVRMQSTVAAANVSSCVTSEVHASRPSLAWVPKITQTFRRTCATTSTLEARGLPATRCDAKQVSSEP